MNTWIDIIINVRDRKNKNEDRKKQYFNIVSFLFYLKNKNYLDIYFSLYLKFKGYGNINKGPRKDNISRIQWTVNLQNWL